jgi:hypothetical protein
MAKIILAGVPGGGSPGDCKRERELNSKFPCSRLHSYYHLKETGGKMIKQNKVSLFLDSGAFSAWSQGVTIDIQEYIRFIKEHQDIIEVYANLDVIGDAEATWSNQTIMEEAGLAPLPVFHIEETTHKRGGEYWLQRCLTYPYFCIGGMARGYTTEQRCGFLDWCFSVVCRRPSRMPEAKVHGFGLTSLRLMLRYPWYSVDSTSWVVTGRMGSVYVPRYKAGKWIYDENSWKVAVSNRSPSTKEAGKHITTFPPRIQEIILDYIHSKGYQMGRSTFKEVIQTYVLKENERWADKKPKDKTTKRQVEVIEEPGICNKYQLRDELNIIYFLDLEKSMPEWPWPFKAPSNEGFGL